MSGFSVNTSFTAQTILELVQQWFDRSPIHPKVAQLQGKVQAVEATPARVNATLPAGWTGTVSYMSSPSGQVWLEGQAVAPGGGGAAGATLFTLPAALRPLVLIQQVVYSVAAGVKSVEVRTDGTVRLVAAVAAGDTIDLSSISFIVGV